MARRASHLVSLSKLLAHSASPVVSSSPSHARYVSTSAVTLDKLGFIGLGNMGMPMARNLLRAGHDLVVCDASPRAVEQLCAGEGGESSAGSARDGDATESSSSGGGGSGGGGASSRVGHVGTASAAATPAQVAATPGLSAVVTMLPSAAAVLDVYTGPAGLLAAPGGVTAPLLIDSSTIDPGTSRAVAAAAAATRLAPGVQPLECCPPGTPSSSGGGNNSGESSSGGGAPSPAVVDAPVSGGVPGAVAGTLAFMVGGAAEAVGAARPYLDAMGRRALHCGGPGAGQAAKLCNNLVLGISMAAVAEGLALGRALGLDPALLAAVFNASSARCWSSDTYCPAPGVMDGVPSSRGYTGGFAAALMCKDLRLAVEAAAEAEAAAAAGGVAGRASVPLGRAALELYKQVAEVDPKTDFSAVYKHVYRGCDD